MYILRNMWFLSILYIELNCMKVITFETSCFFLISFILGISHGLSLNIRSSVITAFLSAIFILLNFSTLHHLSVLDIKYKMFKLMYTGVHKVKLNQARLFYRIPLSFLTFKIRYRKLKCHNVHKYFIHLFYIVVIAK